MFQFVTCGAVYITLCSLINKSDNFSILDIKKKILYDVQEGLTWIWISSLKFFKVSIWDWFHCYFRNFFSTIKLLTPMIACGLRFELITFFFLLRLHFLQELTKPQKFFSSEIISLDFAFMASSRGISIFSKWQLRCK